MRRMQICQLPLEYDLVRMWSLQELLQMLACCVGEYAFEAVMCDVCFHQLHPLVDLIIYRNYIAVLYSSRPSVQHATVHQRHSYKISLLFQHPTCRFFFFTCTLRTGTSSGVLRWGTQGGALFFNVNFDQSDFVSNYFCVRCSSLILMIFIRNYSAINGLYDP